MLSKLVVTVFLLLFTASCFPDGRTVNGADSKIYNHPYMASLRISNSHICGCSIIAPRWVLTSAYCVEHSKIETLSIQYGFTNVSTTGLNVMAVERIIMHEEYSSEILWSPNLALIELKGQLIFNNKTIAPVTLPEPYFEVEQLYDGVPGVVVGWGLNAVCGQSRITTSLQEVDQKIYREEICKMHKPALVGNKQLCAGIDQFGKGVCRSDDGGPLIHNGTLVGVANWRLVPCASIPGVFTKLSHYVDWIHRHINK